MKTRPAHIPAPPKGYTYLGKRSDIKVPASWDEDGVTGKERHNFAGFHETASRSWTEWPRSYAVKGWNGHIAAKPNTPLYNLNVKKTTMKTPPKFNGPCPHRPNYDYKGHFTPPKGWRLVEIGEKYEVGDFFLASGWSWTSAEGIYGEPISGSVYPVIRPATSQRGPNGRFTKPAPKVKLNEEMVAWINSRTQISDLNFRIEAINRVIAGTSASGINQFHWISTPQQSGEMNGYWCARWNGKNEISESDREYMKLIVEGMEARVKVLTPKVKTDMDLLKDRIEALEKENAELKTWKVKVVAAVGT